MLSSSYEDRLRGFELTIGPIRHTYRTSVPVETAEHINDLNVSYPPDTDPQGEAAAHLRMIKATLKATFPNVDGPVSASADDLSSLFVMPVGVVVPFFLPSAEVPTGWALCNGPTVARSDGSGNITTPDLLGRFLIGVSDTYPLSRLGGEASARHSPSEHRAQ